MTEAADRLFVGGKVYTFADSAGNDDGRSGGDSEPDAEAIAVTDGEIVGVGKTSDIEFLEGVETEVVDCGGRVVLPGFVDAHTHMETLGKYEVHADLADAESAADCIERLETQAETEPDREWVLGFGYDESGWADARYLTREDLDRGSEDRPVVAVRVDMHTASLNSVALERLREELPNEDVETTGGEPTGVVVERATDVVWDAIEPDLEETRELLEAAMEYATARGVTGVHDMVRDSHAPRVYRDLAADGELPIRVRLNYWSDHVESVLETGLVTNAGSEFVRVGAIKTFTDGSIGARTAKLFDPYADAGDGDGSEDEAEAEGERGQWVVDPDELRSLVDRVDDAGLQLSVHAIGDEAIEETVSALESTSDAETARHRIEHAELATDDQLERMARARIVASMQPNFHRWAGEDGLYDRRLGDERRIRSNRLRDVLDAGVPLVFGSDCMPLDPLLGVHHAVTAPAEAQRLTVTEALQAYTAGGAFAGCDEDRLGTLEAGKQADLVVLEQSPWKQSDRIDEIDVAMTVVNGEVVSDERDR
ncbi:amidohydrolase [Halobacteria archaeon AArc-m2/3/4]|uniref:Amidohydrolase n=1 Tax=Natronoglomus mannanivorans TaxID=2979990 RepID=A0ABT2QCA7_9EURY|nr:amidohydrolase [Halobacteria archaeon AArc-m2/3/4]